MRFTTGGLTPQTKLSLVFINHQGLQAINHEAGFRMKEIIESILPVQPERQRDLFNCPAPDR